MKIDNQIYQGDFRAHQAAIPDGVVDLVIGDPPYNIGFDYGEDEYKDNLSPASYAQWSRLWMTDVYRILRPNGTFWLMIGDEWAAELKVMANEIGFHMRSWVIWHYTFGVNSPKKLTRSHAHIFYFTKHKTEFTFNASAIRIPSARAVVYNDKRAAPTGRLPDDTWIIRPQDMLESFPAEGDTWFISRICGSFKQRQEGAANQIPEQLIGRIIRACSSEGDLVCDPMAGTGTVLAVAKKLNRKYLGFELSANFFGRIANRLQNTHIGDPLDGPIPQGG